MLLLLFACHHRLDSSLRPDSGGTGDSGPADSRRDDTGRDSIPADDTATPPDSTTVPDGPDADCDGVDDDGNGLVDDGAVDGWARDPTRWRELAVLADPLDPRYAGGLGVGAGRRYVVVGELAENFSDGAVVVYAWTSAGLAERARLEDPALIPFVYAATVDAEGVLWFGGAWWDAGASTRRLFVARWDGAALGELPVKEDADDVRLTTALTTADGRTWWAGYGDLGDGVRPVVWESGGKRVVVSHSLDEEGRFAALATDGESVWTAGWTGGDPATAVLDTYTSGDWHGQRAAEDTRAVAVALGTDGVPRYGHTASDGTGWSVRRDGAVVDTADGDLAHLVQDGARTFAVGTVDTEGGPAVQVRVEEDGAWSGYTLPVDPAWQVEPHRVAVDELGRVWIVTSELSVDGAAPGRARLLRLDCR